MILAIVMMMMMKGNAAMIESLITNLVIASDEENDND